MLESPRIVCGIRVRRCDVVLVLFYLELEESGWCHEEESFLEDVDVRSVQFVLLHVREVK